MTWPQMLSHLQEIDLELERIAARQKEITIEIQDNTELENTRKILKQRQEEATQARQAQETLEFENERTGSKLKQADTKLYSGQVHNAREVADLHAKVNSLKHRREQLEEQLLDAMIEREAVDEQVQEAQQQFTTAEEAWQERQTTLQEEQEQLKTRSRTLTEERTALTPQLPPHITNSYEYLRKRMEGGIVVAHLKNQVCSVCGLETRLAIQQKVRNQEETYCDGCGCLLIK
ncbi:MAG: hypothetical protein JW981_04670 [Anaerolineae bacterium]|nr:hypothetical protein [Anaerolineae bacterium]